MPRLLGAGNFHSMPATKTRSRRVTISLGLLALAGCAPATRVDLGTEPTLEAEIAAKSRGIFEAEQSGDRSALDALLSDRYRYLSSIGGKDRSKTEEIQLQLGVRVETFKIEDVRVVRLNRDYAQLTYVAHQRLVTAEKTICPRSGALETWSQERRGWRIVTRTEWLIGDAKSLICPSAS